MIGFIEVELKKGGRVRLRADVVTTVLELREDRNDPDRVTSLLVQLGTNNHQVITGHTLESLWNLLIQAVGRNVQVYSETVQGIVGYIEPPPAPVEEVEEGRDAA